MAKKNVYYFERFIRECFYVKGVNTATQKGKLHGFQSPLVLLSKAIKTLLIS